LSAVVAYYSIKIYKKHHHHHLNQFHINNNGLVSYSINAKFGDFFGNPIRVFNFSLNSSSLHGIEAKNSISQNQTWGVKVLVFILAPCFAFYVPSWLRIWKSILLLNLNLSDPEIESFG